MKLLAGTKHRNYICMYSITLCTIQRILYMCRYICNTIYITNRNNNNNVLKKVKKLHLNISYKLIFLRKYIEKCKFWIF